jgi:poly-beta-1,6-N-acetyl-D-glucosamine synthase
MSPIYASHMAAFMFWFALAAIFYIYLGYPLLIALLARLRPKPQRDIQSADPLRDPSSLSVTVMISSYQEPVALEKKLRNVLACNGSQQIKQILVGLDGTENADSLTAIDPRIIYVPFPARRGKPSVLNDLMPMATGDILIMMDVRQRLDDDALPALLRNFADPAIGVVSGELVFEREVGDSSDASSIDAYWKLEKWLRVREGRFGSVPGATGALYAIRRELAHPIPPQSSLDDVIIPMQAIAAGGRCIFEPAAKIYDRPAQDASRESIRKRRTLAGCVQLLRLFPRWSLPGGHPIWWQFFSHKIARLFSPFMLLLAAVSNFMLITHPFYLVLALLQAAAYGLAILSLLLPSAPKPLRILGVFLKMQATLLQAWRDALTSTNLALWDKA